MTDPRGALTALKQQLAECPDSRLLALRVLLAKAKDDEKPKPRAVEGA